MKPCEILICTCQLSQYSR